MYSTCIFCHAPLGTNEAIEHFTVGRRLAFDAAKGRLWAVCQRCERWNLTPIEERWEAIEECERLFRDTKLRVSTDNVGLAKLREGTTLVRIGDPQRPEMAAWRYGDQFGRRRRRYLATSAVVTLGAAGFIWFGPIGGLLPVGSFNVLQILNGLRSSRTIARVSSAGKVLKIRATSLHKVELVPVGRFDWRLRIAHYPRWGIERWEEMNGKKGRDALRVLLPHINAAGAGRATVADSVAILEEARSPDDVFARAAGTQRRHFDGMNFTRYPHRQIAALPSAHRLALEMALHETDERRVLEGELAELETRWREAEEIAAISDDLFLPEGVKIALTRLRRS